VANFRAHVLSRTSISPNLGQQFRWIDGQWQRPYPSPRDRVAPSNAKPHQRRQSLPGRLKKDVRDCLSSRDRAMIMLRSSTLKRLPVPRPTGTAVRFEDATKRSPTSPAQQHLGGAAHQQVSPAHHEVGLAHQPTATSYKPPGVAPPFFAQQEVSSAYQHRSSAPQSSRFPQQLPVIANQKPVVACRPQQPDQDDFEHAAAVGGTSPRSQERSPIVQVEQVEAWPTGVEYAPAWSRTMAAPVSRSEATMSFTKRPQTHGSNVQVAQSQIFPPYSPEDRSSGRPTIIQPVPQLVEPVGPGTAGGVSLSSPRPPPANQPSQRPAAAAEAAPGVRREAVRQKKMVVLEKADSVDEDEFDKLVAINYKQLVDSPPTPSSASTLSLPTVGDPRHSPKLSPRLARKPLTPAQTPPTSPAPPTVGAPPPTQAQQTSAGTKTEEESEDELSK